MSTEDAIRKALEQALAEFPELRDVPFRDFNREYRRAKSRKQTTDFVERQRRRRQSRRER